MKTDLHHLALHVPRYRLCRVSCTSARLLDQLLSEKTSNLIKRLLPVTDEHGTNYAARLSTKPFEDDDNSESEIKLSRAPARGGGVFTCYETPHGEITLCGATLRRLFSSLPENMFLRYEEEGPIRRYVFVCRPVEFESGHVSLFSYRRTDGPNWLYLSRSAAPFLSLVAEQLVPPDVQLTSDNLLEVAISNAPHDAVYEFVNDTIPVQRSMTIWHSYRALQHAEELPVPIRVCTAGFESLFSGVPQTIFCSVKLY